MSPDMTKRCWRTLPVGAETAHRGKRRRYGENIAGVCPAHAWPGFKVIFARLRGIAQNLRRLPSAPDCEKLVEEIRRPESCGSRRDAS